MKFFIIALCCVAAVSGSKWMDAGEAKLVQDSLSKVKDVDILYAVFKDNPDIQAKFTQFAGKNLDELKGTPAFALHAGRIVGFLVKYVNLLGNDANDGKIQGALDEFVASHASRSVTKAQLEGFKGAAAKYLKGVGVDGSTVSAWAKALDLFIAAVVPRL